MSHDFNVKTIRFGERNTCEIVAAVLFMTAQFGKSETLRGNKTLWLRSNIFLWRSYDLIWICCFAQNGSRKTLKIYCIIWINLERTHTHTHTHTLLNYISKEAHCIHQKKKIMGLTWQLQKTTLQLWEKVKSSLVWAATWGLLETCIYWISFCSVVLDVLATIAESFWWWEILKTWCFSDTFWKGLCQWLIHFVEGLETSLWKNLCHFSLFANLKKHLHMMPFRRISRWRHGTFCYFYVWQLALWKLKERRDEHCSWIYNSSHGRQVLSHQALRTWDLMGV